MLHETIFSLSKKQHSNIQNSGMTTCLISTFLLGTSASQAIGADNVVEQCPSLVPESLRQPYPKAIEQHVEKGAVTSGEEKVRCEAKE
mgnify:CR=1 FL=1